MPDLFRAAKATVKLSIDDQFINRVARYGTEHRPPTMLTPEEQTLTGVDMDVFSGVLNAKGCPWDIHISHAVLMLNSATDNENRYIAAARLAALCEAMMLDLRTQH